MKYASKSGQRAFTILEMNIVIAIVALLIGGLILGRSLIHAAQLRSVTEDIQNIMAATEQFREKYHAKPGDMPNATKYWGESSMCDDFAEIGTQNGDGDNNIDHPMTREPYRVFQHLANAGFIAGTYGCGSGNGELIGVVPGFNSPKTAIDGMAFSFANDNDNVITNPADAYYFPGVYKDMMEIGYASRWEYSSTTPSIMKPVFSAPDAFALDSKIDDGRPAYGSIVSYKDVYDGTTDTHYSCATTTTASTAEYAATTDDWRCVLLVNVFSN